MTDFAKMADAVAAIGFACGVLEWAAVYAEEPHQKEAILKARDDLEAIDLMAIYEKKDPLDET